MSGTQHIVEIDPLADLLLASGRGDRRAFARVYHLSASRLYPIALRLMRRRALADEVLQEAFVLVWTKAAQYRADRGRPLAWMATIVRNCAIDRLRATKSEPHDPPRVEDMAEVLADPNPAGGDLPHHMTAAIRTCLGRLKADQRSAILLAYYYGMTHEELSAQLGTPLGTVKSWVRRGLLQLRDCLET